VLYTPADSVETRHVTVGRGQPGMQQHARRHDRRHLRPLTYLHPATTTSVATAATRLSDSQIDRAITLLKFLYALHRQILYRSSHHRHRQQA